MKAEERRLEQELNGARQRLRRVVEGVTLDEIIDDPATPHADPMDETRESLDREIAFTTRSLLVERTRRLAAALERVRNGSYGVCDECGGTIAAARLRALPEVATCVGCQERLERLAAQRASLPFIEGELQ
jgi:DnaK suppressor protein